MCINKITIRTGTSYPEELSEEFIQQITKDFTMYVTPFTSNKKLLIKAGVICQCNDDFNDLSNRFQMVFNGAFYRLDYSGRLSRLIRFLGSPKSIDLEYVIGLPGGLGIDKKNGITYFFHTKELRHTPHIHARYQGEEISIEILTLKVRGAYRNRKRQNEAVEYVKSNARRLLTEYNMKTNGIHISPEYLENGETAVLSN